MPTPNVHITVISDFACPWCHVGHVRLSNALSAWSEARPKSLVQVDHVPYMIDPATDPSGEDYLAYNVRRWGGDGWVRGMKQSAAKDGVAFRKWTVWPNTLHAHRLMRLARDFDAAARTSALLFETIYERGGNASDADTLAAVGAEAGMPEQAVRDLLAGSEGREEVLHDDRYAKRQLGVSGVPCFFIASGESPDADGSSDKRRERVLQGAVGTDKILAALQYVAPST